jgi:hypothetical protein
VLYRAAQKTASLDFVTSRFFRVPVSQIGYVRAIVEGYDGVAQIFAPDWNRGEIEWRIPAGQEREAEAIALRLAKEADLQDIERPDDWPEG